MIDKKRLKQIFNDLLKINSPTYKEKEISNYIIEYLMSKGFEVYTDDSYHTTGSNIGNVIAKIKGNVKAKPVMLNAHMDTIESTENIKLVEEKDIIKTDGKCILGGDSKAGIAVILEAISILKENNLKHGPVELVFTTAEELCLRGSRELDYSKIDAKDCFVFDSGGPAGTIVIGAPSQKNINLNFQGQAAHAGVEPENGINAILAASKAISKMPQGRIDEETTTNVGVISGGKATNVVPAKCYVKAEARGHDEKKLEETIHSIFNIAKEESSSIGAKVDVNVEDIYKGYRIKEEQTVFKVSNLALKEIDEEPFITVSGGGSDANIFNDLGINAIALSAGVYDAHSVNEFVNLADLYRSAMLATKIIEIYAGESIECYT